MNSNVNKLQEQYEKDGYLLFLKVLDEDLMGEAKEKVEGLQRKFEQFIGPDIALFA